jgi:hypothetical protein
VTETAGHNRILLVPILVIFLAMAGNQAEDEDDDEIAVALSITFIPRWDATGGQIAGSNPNM